MARSYKNAGSPFPCTTPRRDEPSSRTRGNRSRHTGRPAEKPCRHEKARISGLSARLAGHFRDFEKTGTPPAITLIRTSFGDPGTGRPGIPFFTPGLTPHWRRAQRFGNPGTGRPGIPSLLTGSYRTSRRAPPVSGALVQAGQGSLFTPDLALMAPSPQPLREPGTGRPGPPAFIARPP